MLPFVIAGLVTGAVYGLAGVGLVLTYKSSGIFNFGHGALATVAAYLFYTLTVEHGLPWPLAAGIAVLVVGPALAFAMELLARAISGTGLAVQVAATVGVLLIVQGAVTIMYGLVETRTVPVFLGHGQFSIDGTYIQYSDVTTFLIAFVLAIALYVFFRITRRGAAMRAVVDDPTLLELTGTSATATRRWAWVIGVGFASISGVLMAPLLPLDGTVLTLLVVQAFGAAALGGFLSLPGTLVGGLVLGVVASIATKYSSTSGILGGLPPALPFLVLFVVLLVFPKRYLVERSRIVARSEPAWSAPVPLQLGGAVVLLALLLCAPAFVGIHLGDWTTALGTIIIFLSLGLLVRTSGQVSLGHIGFAAVGVTAFAHFSTAGLPWLLALLCAGLVAVPIGALLALPAARLGGLYLALATFGFGVALSYMFYSQSFMFGSGAGVELPRPQVLGFASNRGYYYLVLIFVVLAVALIVGLVRGRLGRLLRSMSDSSLALTSTGASTAMTRTIVFCLSAFLAALGGALIGGGQQVVAASSYPPLLSLTYLALVVIAFGKSPWYAIVAGLSLVLVPSYISGANTPYWLQIIFGVAAILFAVTPESMQGLPAVVTDRIDRVVSALVPGWRWTGRSTRPGEARARVHSGRQGLRLEGVTVRYGGVTALDGLRLTAPIGQITGLIGPNGAGKTTTFNACSGLLKPSAGSVWFNGVDVTRQSVAARARMGLGRTFQKSQLFGTLSVRQNVEMGAEGARAGRNPLSHMFARHAHTSQVRAHAEWALEVCGITALADLPASRLSTGHQRLVELARCLAGDFDMLLLDEPSSGLDEVESQRFGDILRFAVDELGIGILLVEHDMSLVMRLCREIFVIDFGKPLFRGSPVEVSASRVVQDAYLGTGLLSIDVSAGDVAEIAVQS